jgi:hypothetical protein
MHIELTGPDFLASFVFSQPLLSFTVVELIIWVIVVLIFVNRKAI